MATDNNTKLATALQAAAAPESMTTLSAILGVAPQALQMIRDVGSSSISTTYGQTLPGIGFTKLALSYTVDRSWYDNMNDLGEALQNTINNEWKAMPRHILQPLSHMATQFRLGKLKQKDFIKLYVGDTSLGGLYVAIGPHKLWNGEPAKLFAWSHMGGSWTKAADYIVVTHSESDFFGSSTSTSLQRLPKDNKGTTPADIDAFTSLMHSMHQRFRAILSDQHN